MKFSVKWDMDTIEKIGDDVIIWTKFVREI
jgi:hypothetical protein